MLEGTLIAESLRVGATLAECAQHYFRQSEQLQAGIKLSVARSGPEGNAFSNSGFFVS